MEPPPRHRNNDEEIGGGGSLNLPSASIFSRRLPGARQNFQWSPQTLSPSSIVPPPRSGAASVVVNGKLYVFGGYGGGTGRLDDFYSFDFATSSWEEVEVLSTERPGCRENNGVVISDSSRSIYLFGGYNGNHWLNDLWKFDIDSQRWTCIQESSSDVNEVDDVEGANLNGDVAGAGGAMLAATGIKPSQRFGYVSVVHENKLVLFGGFDGNRWLNDMYVFDFQSKKWSLIEAKGNLPSPRSCPAWAKDEAYVYMQGGYDGVDRKNDFFALDLASYTWIQMPCLGDIPSPRYFHSCCLYGSKMYLYGGYSGSQRLADMYAYDFETNHWSRIICHNGQAPSGRSSLVAQVYGNHLYIFGGYNGQSVLNDFYRFRLTPIGIPAPSLVRDFKRLLDDRETSDVVFLVEGNEVYAHRAILAARSEYFRVLLLNGHMRESLQAVEAGGGGLTGRGTPVEIRDVSHSVFVKVLEYIYTDTVHDVSLELAIHLLIASEQFMLDRLKALCEELIRRQVCLDNVISILLASHRHNAASLKQIALEYIMTGNNLSEPAILTGLEELKSEPDLLVEIIQQTSLKRLATTQNSFADDLSLNLQQAQVDDSPERLLAQGPFGQGAEWNARR